MDYSRTLGHLAASTLLLCALAAPANAATVTISSATFSDDGPFGDDFFLTLVDPNATVLPFGVSITASVLPQTLSFNLDLPRYFLTFVNPDYSKTYTENVSVTFQLTAPVTQTVTVHGKLTGFPTGFPVLLSVDWTPTLTSLPGGIELILNVGRFGPNPLGGKVDITLQEAAVPQVPLPAAVWLFGTVIAGYASVSRWRRRKQIEVVTA